MNSSWRRLKLLWGRGLVGHFLTGRGLSISRSQNVLRLGYSPSDIDFTFYRDVLKRLLSKPLFPQRPSTTRNGARSRSLREDAVDAGLTHLVVTFWIDEEPHVRVEIAGRFTNRANVWEGRGRRRISRGWMEA